MEFLLIGIGGALGSIARYWGAGFATRALNLAFPSGTLAVNVIGSFLMGLAFVVIIERLGAPNRASLFVMTGFLGGFTTFSAFSLDAIQLLSADRFGAAALYIGSSVILSLAALFLGIIIARSLT